MSADDPLSDWAKSRRSDAVPDGFSRRVTEAISAEPSHSIGSPSPPPRLRRRDRLEQAAGVLLIVCSCVVAVVRLSSLAGLIVPSTDDRIITQEFFDESEEVSHVAPDVT